MLRLRVTGVGGWRRADRGWQRGFWDVGGSKEPSHAGFVRRMKSRWVVGTCWRGGGKKRREHSFALSRDNNKNEKLFFKFKLLFKNGLTGWLIMGRVVCRVGLLIVQLRRLRRMRCTQHELTVFGHRSAAITPPNCCQGRRRCGVADWSPGRRDGLPNGRKDSIKRKN